MTNIDKEFNLHEFTPYVKLIEAVVYQALSGPRLLFSAIDKKSAVERRRKRNLEVARSVFVEDLCECYDLNPELIRKKIYQANSKKQFYSKIKQTKHFLSS